MYPAKYTKSSRKKIHGKVNATGIMRMKMKLREMVEKCNGMAEKCFGEGWQ